MTIRTVVERSDPRFLWLDVQLAAASHRTSEVMRVLTV
jgi:hypothetical protein